MFEKGRRKGTTRFAVKPEGAARAVAVAGDFSAWKPLGMRRQKDGVFVLNVPTAKASFEYKFLIDGTWVTDPDNPHMAPDPFGTFNSVVPEDADAVMRL